MGARELARARPEATEVPEEVRSGLGPRPAGHTEGARLSGKCQGPGSSSHASGRHWGGVGAGGSLKDGVCVSCGAVDTECSQALPRSAPAHLPPPPRLMGALSVSRTGPQSRGLLCALGALYPPQRAPGEQMLPHWD